MTGNLTFIVLMFALSAFSFAQLSGQSTPPTDCTAYPASAVSLYILPWENGKSYEVWRTTTHYSPGNRGVGFYAIDFQMPVGSKIAAAREGKVVAVQESYSDGNGEDLKENLVFVQHADGTVARYFHLTHNGALVNVGDTIKQGQIIALSGNTGDSAGPHLHFDVQGCGPNLNPNYNRFPCAQTLPLTFRNTEDNSCGLIANKTYKALDFTPNTETSGREADKSAITQTASDYVEGWYVGDANKIQRALHPEFAKRTINPIRTGSELNIISAMSVMNQTQAGLGKSIPKEKRLKDITIFEISRNTASIKITAFDSVDYLHLARFNGRWVIVNILSERKEK